MNKFLLAIVLMFASIIVWGLAVLWHPFGTPKMIWHVLNAVAVVGSFWGVIHFSNKANGEKESGPE